MANVAVGKVLRFDSVRGYGFIEPDAGGEDLFLHVNDLLDDKHLIRPGTIVEFEVASGDRGLKACGVQIRSQPQQGIAARSIPSGSSALSAVPRAPGDSDEPLCDVLSRDDFLREVTDLLLRVDPTLTGQQILIIRERLAKMGLANGWVEN